MDSQALLYFHVAISLIAILTGVIVLYGLLTANRMAGMTLVFLVTTFLTSATGFLFHRDHILPSHIVGVIALVVVAIGALALYTYKLRGFWRVVYVIAAVASLYFNVFVLVAQGFLKVPALHELAPTGAEPPFAIAQGIVLVVYIALGVMAVKRFKPAVV
jgi:hypothetical protein